MFQLDTICQAADVSMLIQRETIAEPLTLDIEQPDTVNYNDESSSSTNNHVSQKTGPNVNELVQLETLCQAQDISMIAGQHANTTTPGDDSLLWDEQPNTTRQTDDSLSWDDETSETEAVNQQNPKDSPKTQTSMIEDLGLPHPGDNT
jgi:hypothetical protein